MLSGLSCPFCHVFFILCFSSSWFALTSHFLIFYLDVSIDVFFFCFSTLSYIAHCPISPSLFDFWLPAFTALSSSRSMGEFATALPLQGAHSKSLSLGLPSQQLSPFPLSLMCVGTLILFYLDVTCVSACSSFVVCDSESLLTISLVENGDNKLWLIGIFALSSL